MDERSFDTLTKALATSSSRRRMLKTLLAGVGGGALASKQRPMSFQSTLLTQSAAALTSTQTSAPTLHYYGLGDSIASGHGLGDRDGPKPGEAPPGYTGGTCQDCDDGGHECRECCRRSDRAYPARAVQHLEALGFNVDARIFACTGGTSLRPDTLDNDLTGDAAAADRSDHRNPWRLLKNQVDEVLRRLEDVGDDPVLVSFTIGANDFEFANEIEFILRVQVIVWDSFDQWMNERLALARAAIAKQVDRLLEHRNVTVVITEVPNPFYEESIFFLGPLCAISQCYWRTVAGVLALNTALHEVVAERAETGRLALVPIAAEFEKHKPSNSTCRDIRQRPESDSDEPQPFFQERDDLRSNSFSVPWSLWELRREEVLSRISSWQLVNIPFGLAAGPAIDLLAAQWRRHSWRGDCVHPNDEGAQYIAQQVAKAAKPLLSKYLEPEPTTTPQPPDVTVGEVIAGTLRAIDSAGTYRYDLHQPPGTLISVVEIDLSNGNSMTLQADGEARDICVGNIIYSGPGISVVENLSCPQIPGQNPFFDLIGQWLSDPSVPWTLQPQIFMSGRVAYPLEWRTFDGNPPMVRQLWVDSETLLPLKAFVRQPVEYDYIEWELVFGGWGTPLDIQPPPSQTSAELSNSGSASEMATVVVSGLTCTGYAPGIYTLGPISSNPTPDLSNCTMSTEAATLRIVDPDGNEHLVEVQANGPTQFSLPFGDYQVTLLEGDLRTTLSIHPDARYEAECGAEACPLYWLIEYNLQPHSPVVTGTVTLFLYECPPDVTPAAASPASCQLGGTEPLDLYFWNDEIGQSVTLADAAWNGESYTWSGLPFGTYILAPEWGPGLVGSIYVPGFESFDSGSATVDWDDTTFPATPDYTVSMLSGTGYWVPLTSDNATVTLDVYAFGPECWDEICEDASSITSSQGSGQATSSSDAHDILIAEAIEWFGGDWTGIFYQSNPTREWPIELSYWGGPEGTVVGSIAYLPNICEADLIQLKMVLDFGLGLQEQVTTGQENCVSGGTINLERSGSGELTFTWFHPDSDATGHGTLQKVGSSEPSTTGTGSLEIHAVRCPQGFAGPDYYNACHSNGEAGAEFMIDGAVTLTVTTDIDPSSGVGMARLNGLESGSYYVARISAGAGTPAFVFCSPDRGETELVSQFVSASEGVQVPVTGEAVVCDWYSLP
jgi:hypothetical protein